VLANDYIAIGILDVKRLGSVELLYPGKLSNRGTRSRDQRVWRKPRATRAYYCPKGEKHSCKLDSGLRELQIRQTRRSIGARHTSPSFLATHLLHTSSRQVALNRAASLPRQDVPDRESCASPAWWTRLFLITWLHGPSHDIAALGHPVVLALATANLCVQVFGSDVDEAAT
jgi:hypothetical protein